MKKILILIVMVFGLVACGEKFPYTSQSNKEKMIKELQVAIEEKRSSEGDEKAKEELDKWDKMLKEMKPQV